MDLKFHLEEVLGIRVDLVTEAGVRPELRESIARDAVRVA
jgi:predicted nucleotidyltransferase